MEMFKCLVSHNDHNLTFLIMTKIYIVYATIATFSVYELSTQSTALTFIKYKFTCYMNRNEN